MSDFYRDEGRRAARDHRCGECGETIAKGAQYTHASGRWDGSMWSAKWCGRCAAVRAAACQYARYIPEECPEIPGLAQWLIDSFDELHDIKTNTAIIEAGSKLLADMLAKGKRAP